jgi:electron transport complex protein RnfD
MAENATTTESDTQAATPQTHVAPGPHLSDHKLSTRRMMVDVIIALSPLVIVALIMYRQYAVLQLAVAIGGCLAAEALFAFMRKRRPTLGDCSAIVTGMILALSLPWNTPIYVGLIAAFIAIGIGKMIFGGVGYNLFNPAMVGRAFVMLAFAGAVGAPAYVEAGDVGELRDKMPWLESLGAMPAQYAEVPDGGADTVSAATPMTAKKMKDAGEAGGFLTKFRNLAFGNTIGSLGEVSAIACILGGLYLCLRRTASWEIPAGAIGAVVILGGIGNLMDPSSGWTVLDDLAGGALLFGAFFIITDPVTSPLTPKGKLVFGLVFGALVMLLREYSNYPEGVMFAVLMVNAIAPLLNRWTVPKPLGGPAPIPTK